MNETGTIFNLRSLNYLEIEKGTTSTYRSLDNFVIETGITSNFRYLKSPPECWWECTNKEMSATLEPGDIIVVNTNWWMHSTKVVGGRGLSVTITNQYI